MYDWQSMPEGNGSGYREGKAYLNSLHVDDLGLVGCLVWFVCVCVWLV